ncbi:MAG: Mrp/NBP35 family ATP-binding protein [Candidatus Marsarchaeota archaeon]|jgi:ATP-binding protein involved in chromosome partitioning|nr:Mrp/NBP35 family ATP-binding protein [Candidatus Marsarchaeota archaeon]
MTDTEHAHGAGTNMMHPSILRVIEDKKAINQKLSNIRHKIGIYSAKGGVGKTTVAVNTAFTLSSMGYKVGLIDADIDCPNTLMFLGIQGTFSDEYPLKPAEKDGVKVVSTAMFVDDAKKPIIWRGPIVAKMIREFLDSTDWGALDYLIIDLPPGTSDAPLSIIQLLSLDGFILVTTPRHISAINTIRSGMMAKRLNVALLGVVETMSDGSGNGGEEVAKELGCELIGRIMADKRFGELSDAGKIPVLNDEGIRLQFESMIKKTGLVDG